MSGGDWLGVWLSSAVVEPAKRLVDFAPDQQMRVHVDDGGRSCAPTPEATWDAIVPDAFGSVG